MHRLAIALVALLVCAASLSAAEKQAITVVLEKNAVTATGVTPGARVVFFGVGREPKTYYSIVRPVATIVADDDRDGTVRITTPVYRRSQWAVVDLVTGSVAMAAPKRFGVDARPLKEEHFKKATNGKLRKLELSMLSAEVMWVRPEVGAWGATIFEGGRDDDDHQPNGKLLFDSAVLKAVPGTTAPPPDELGLRDVIIIVEPDEITMHVLEGRK